jgi:hypothetical protein
VDDGRAPEGVRMVIDGREIPCTMRRMPSEDHECHDGEWCRAWLAIPDVPVTVVPGFSLAWKASFMPAHASLVFDISVPVSPGDLN